ncbi:MAG: AAA family ATPase [Thermoplasmata archaeon]|nr:AAA family ATPase [Thermoplasmata archaeon]
MASMKVGVENAGALPEAEIRLDGLTFIAGVNGTGKSTVLKHVYAMMRVLADSGAYGKLLEMKRDGRLHQDEAGLVLDGGLDARFSVRSVAEELRCEFRFPVQLREDQVRGRIDIRSGEGAGVPFIPQVVYYDSTSVLDMGNDTPRCGGPDHRQNLMRLLLEGRVRSATGEDAEKATSGRLYELVCRVVPGEFAVSESGAYLEYIGPEGTFSTEDMADGMKLFSVLKILMDGEKLPIGSVLLLDDPDVHMHPEWQNILAEVIVLLVKQAGVRVVMTTHSQQLALGVQAMSERYGQHVDYYHFLRGEDGSTECEDVTQNIGRIYEEMAAPYSAIANVLWSDIPE